MKCRSAGKDPHVSADENVLDEEGRLRSPNLRFNFLFVGFRQANIGIAAVPPNAKLLRLI